MDRIDRLFLIAIMIVSCLVALGLLLIWNSDRTDNRDELVEHCEMLVMLMFDDEAETEHCAEWAQLFYRTYKTEVDKCFELYDDALLARCLGQIADG